MIHVSARFGPIPSASLAAFKELGESMMKTVQGEAGTVRYNWFLSADQSVCVVREIYADSSAALTHIGNAGDALMRLVVLGGGLQIEVFGELSEELTEVLKGFGDVPVLVPFQSK